jgi:hypothetical protein
MPSQSPHNKKQVLRPKNPRAMCVEQDEMIYDCFVSSAQVNDKEVKIGVEESTALKRAAVFKGMTTAKGRPRKRLTWLEVTVAMMREATSAPHFNHEWWAAELSKPDWMKRLDEHYTESWLYFPKEGELLSAGTLGSKLGYDLTLSERMVHRADTDTEFLQEWKSAETRKAMRGTDPELEKKTRVVFMGIESWEKFAPQAAENTREFRGAIFAFVSSHANPDEHADFVNGFNNGMKRAFDDFNSDPFSEKSETKEIVEIFSEHWPSIGQLDNRAEVAKFVLRHFSPERRKFLEDDFQARRFADQIRNICRQIGFKPAKRGRPRKNGEMSKGA